MKKLLIVAGMFVTLVGNSFAAEDGIWDINANNSSVGTLTLVNNGTSGHLYYTIEQMYEPLEKVLILSGGGGLTKSITFTRGGLYRQVYEGWISTDGCIMSGYLINDNLNMPHLDKYPFIAKKQGCQEL
jgi:hypothetical protein